MDDKENQGEVAPAGGPRNPENIFAGLFLCNNMFSTEYESYGESVLSLGCDAERDRRRKITKDNPTGIRRGGESDHSDRMKYPHKVLDRLVSDAKKADRIKGLVCDLPEDWAVKKAEEQNGCCKRTGHPFDYTYMTRQEGSNILKPSINRIDNTKPHTIDNCELILRFLNLGFGNAPKHLVDKSVKNPINFK